MEENVEVLEYILKETVDLENIPIEEVFENLRCSREGLTTQAAEERLAIFGHNKLEEKKERKFLKFLGFMWNPLSWVMEAAAIMAIALANGGGKPPDWQDFMGIMTLLLINSTISFIKENNAGNAAAALMARLAPKAKSALTGESLPVTKGPGDGVYSGSTCKQGDIEATVIATGVHTFFGKAAYLVDTTNQVLTAIGKFFICSIAVGMIIEIIVIYPIQYREYCSGIDNLSHWRNSNCHAYSPVSHNGYWFSEGAITKRMTAIEEMAGMDVLCCDKTRTLTLNKLTVDKNLIEVFSKGGDADTAVLMAAQASRIKNQDAMDTTIVGMLADPKEIYAVSIIIRIVLGFMLLALIWKFDFPPFMVLIIAILNDGTIMTISKDRVKPDSWKLAEIITTRIVLGSYLAMMTVIFFWAAYKMNFFPRVFGVSTLEKTTNDGFRKLASVVYLQVSTISQALIFVTQSRSWSYAECPGILLVVAFVIAQLVSQLPCFLVKSQKILEVNDNVTLHFAQIATLLAVYAD
ncbi:hypothetical protein SADUNF_Sadunf15G0058900 [Salix dunnii]|uniref:Cation-transporting P-type ATPase N-terminal domain-containing protein n=1 Tax=Salix dunnii TaxID=1413687 RepID=A0A835MSA5_9ROSI|nr:hypothetical protein SADUNF_Sadunf15G0058900 [Salix dunnii]